MVTDSKQELLTTIEYRRKALIELGLINGLNDPDIIKLSQELDQLIYEYQELSTYSKS